ncbi:MAG TPA: hypothetical protein HPP94_08230 [Desulfuromonadales bacterium]|nr:hypothetical protein [Desulfuromonadales bacterium]
MTQSDDLSVSSMELINHLKMTGRFDSVSREVLERKVTVEQARQKGMEISPEKLQQAVDLFRQINGLHTAVCTESWMKVNNITVSEVGRYIEESLLIKMFTEYLEDSTSQDMYISSPEIQGAISRMMYQDWLEGVLT